MSAAIFRGWRWSEDQLERSMQLRDRMALQLPAAEEKLGTYQAELDRQREELRLSRERLADLAAAIDEQLAMRGPLPPPALN